MRRYVIISDTQCPDQHRKAVSAVTDFIADWQPDVLLHVGDDIDSPETSRWNKGLAGEYARTLQAGIDDARQVHAGFRAALGAGKPFHLSRSNHTDRTEKYVRKYAPALSSLRSLRIEELLGYEDYGITYHRHVFEFTPGWVLAHGDEGGLSQTPGGTALSLAKRLNKSVIAGHTHRLGLQHETRGLAGKTTTIFGMEVGNLMDMKKAKYLKTGSANWCMGIGLLYVDGKDVYPNMVPIKADGSFSVEGKTYRG